MDELSADSGTETIAVPPPLPESGADATGGDFNVGLAVLMGFIVVLVCIQNLWLRRRADRENAAADERGTT